MKNKHKSTTQSHVAASVIMPVYNAESFLRASISSILNQTFECFEFIIIYDPSTDETYKTLEEYARKDGRIKLIHNTTRSGLSSSLNQGIAISRAPYIVRMDADDVSTPDRLQRQLAFMDAHPEVGALGCSISIIDEHDQIVGSWTPPEDHDGLWMTTTTVGSPFAHPSAVIRADLLKKIGGYRTQFQETEDYDLFLRLGEHCRFASLPDTLLDYRVVTANESPAKLQRLIHQGYMKVLALASWQMRLDNKQDFIEAFQTPITLQQAEALALPYIHSKNSRLILNWISVLWGTPQWPDREDLLADAWKSFFFTDLPDLSELGDAAYLLDESITLFPESNELRRLVQFIRQRLTATLAGTQAILNEKYEDIKKAWDIVAEKDAHIASTWDIVAEKDAQIAKMWSTIADLGKQIEERDKCIKSIES